MFRTIILMSMLLFDDDLKALINKDIARMKNETGTNSLYVNLSYALLRNIPYRNIYYYRLQSLQHYICLFLSKPLLPHRNKIEIGGYSWRIFDISWCW